MKKSALVLMFVAFALVLTACLPTVNTDSAETVNDVYSDKVNAQHDDSQIDPQCPTGVELFDVQVGGESDMYYTFEGGVGSFIIRPNEGCDLPVLYCIVYGYGYQGGLSCTPINP